MNKLIAYFSQVLCLSVWGLLAPGISPVLAGTLTVLNTNDSGASSFRQAVVDAAPGDTIDFAPGVTGVITFTNGPVTIAKDLTILGPGANLLAFDGGFNTNLVIVSAGAVVMADFTFSNGYNTTGGAVRLTGGSLTISNCVFSGDTAPPGTGGLGGGIYASAGNLLVVNSLFAGNRARSGGGIYFGSANQITLRNSTFQGNEATAGPSASGAAIYNGGTMIMQGCTIASNMVSSGSGFGGGIQNAGTSAQVRGSIIAGNSAPTDPDVGGIFSSDGYNLIGRSGGVNGFTNGVIQDQVGSLASPINPMLGPLQDNGGPTATMALLGGSPAIDRGISGGLTTDQRGRPRPFDHLLIANAPGGDGSDIGAYEGSLIVLNTNDSGAGSLRQAIFDNNASGGNNTVIFAGNVTGQITLTNGEMLISKNLSLAGPGADVLAVSGNNSNRIFRVASNAVANISGLTLAQGRDALGGAILQQSGSLSLNLCILSNNVSTAQGGGIAAAGVTTLTQCTLTRNRGVNDGGGIFQTNGTLTIASCTFSFNTNTARGGAITVNPDAMAIFNNSTFVSNVALFGGALMLYPTVKITNCTFTANSATFGGGIDNFGTANTTIRNTILAGNAASASGRDCYGAFTSAGYNLIGVTNDSTGWTATGDQVGTAISPLNPLLGPLQNNGGPTLTLSPLTASPAIDKGKTIAGATDQRGRPRPYDFVGTPNATGGDGSDIGAVEVSPDPQLSVRLAGSDAVLSWPVYYSDFLLESTPALLNPPNVWTTVPSVPVIVGPEYIVTNNIATGNEYYRLRRP